MFTNKWIYIILDVCHVGILARSAVYSLVPDIISDTARITLAAYLENEESNVYEEMGQEVFAYFLCEEIQRTPIQTPVYIEELKIYVCSRVLEWGRLILNINPLH